MISEAINRICELAQRGMEAIMMDNNAREKTWFLPSSGEFKTYPKDPLKRNHIFTTLEGFTDYLTSKHCAEDSGIIFVGGGDIVVDMRYGDLLPQRARLPLNHSEEYSSLINMMGGLKQKELWRELITAQDGCLPPDLLLAIGQIQTSITGEGSAEVDNVGMGGSSSSNTVSVTFPKIGGKEQGTATIQVDWTWTGRVWSAFEHMSTLDLRLEIQQGETGLLFIFHPKRLDKMRDDTRLALVEHLKGAGLNNFTVHEGTL